jgi:two-component system sensor histidine kinase KdpD
MAERESKQSPTGLVAEERLLACVGEAPGTAALIRYAQRAADELQAPWTAIYVETAPASRLSDAERDRIAEHLRLADRPGASTIIREPVAAHG